MKGAGDPKPSAPWVKLMVSTARNGITSPCYWCVGSRSITRPVIQVRQNSKSNPHLPVLLCQVWHIEHVIDSCMPKWCQVAFQHWNHHPLFLGWLFFMLLWIMSYHSFQTVCLGKLGFHRIIPLFSMISVGLSLLCTLRERNKKCYSHFQMENRSVERPNYLLRSQGGQSWQHGSKFHKLLAAAGLQFAFSGRQK